MRSIETVLRNAIRQILPDEAWLRREGAPNRGKLEGALLREAQRRDGVVSSTDLLEYTMTRELTEIVLRNWSDFEPIFGDRERTNVYFDTVNGVRNAIAHSRDLAPAERDLLSGIAGLLGNQLSIFVSEHNARARYYPTIERVIDGFNRTLFTHSADYDDYTDRIRLDIGQPIKLSGRAASARGREISWILSVEPNLRPARRLEVGRSLDLDYTYVPTINDVSEELRLAVYIVADSQFHRHPTSVGSVDALNGGYDDARYIRYSINPPEDG